MAQVRDNPGPVSEDAARRQEAQALAAMLGCVFVGMTFMVWWGRRDAGGIELDRRPENAYQYRVDLNRANEMELQHLPGIGPSLASRIVADRDAGGEFRSLDDLTTRVRGVGPSLVERIRPFLGSLADDEPSRPTGRVAKTGKRGRKTAATTAAAAR